MQGYLLRRLLIAIPTLWGITILIFVVLRVLPGDPITAVFGSEGFFVLSKTDQQRFRASLGLDKPLVSQYFLWMKQIFKGELGESFWRKWKVRDLVVTRGPISAQIAIMAVVLSWLVGLPVGILSAMKRNSWMDYVARVGTIFFLAIPGFWIGLVIIVMTVLVFSWRPPIEIVYLWDQPIKNLQMTAGPAFALGMGAAAYIARFTRSSVLEVMGEDYVRTARSKGLMEQVVMWRHVLKNALIPVVTATGLILGGLLAGSVAVEQAFGVPGLGTQLVFALGNRDYAVIQNLVLLYGVVFVFINLIVDILYGVIDPRISYQ